MVACCVCTHPRSGPAYYPSARPACTHSTTAYLYVRDRDLGRGYYTGNSPASVSPRVLSSVVAVPWSLSDLETTQEIHGLEPAPVLCSTPIKVSNWAEG